MVDCLSTIDMGQKEGDGCCAPFGGGPGQVAYSTPPPSLNILWLSVLEVWVILIFPIRYHWCYSTTMFQLLGNFVPRPPTGAPSLDPAEGLPSRRHTLLCSMVFKFGLKCFSTTYHISEWCNAKQERLQPSGVKEIVHFNSLHICWENLFTTSILFILIVTTCAAQNEPLRHLLHTKVVVITSRKQCTVHHTHLDLIENLSARVAAVEFLQNERQLLLYFQLCLIHLFSADTRLDC